MNMWLVGAGYWGSKLLDSLKKFNVDAKVIDIRNGQTIADITDTAPVMLATPLWQHHEQAQELLKRGHDVYVEKPMAETYQQVQDVGACVKPGQLLMVGHIFVHHPQMAEIKELIHSGAIGQLTHISSRRLNWGIYQTKTDPLLSLATHDISIVLELAGNRPLIEQAQSWNYSNNVHPDRVWFSGVCNPEVTFDIDVSWYWPVRTRQTIIIGTEGQIVWDQDANVITVTQNRIQDRRAVADNAPRVIEYAHNLTPLEAELKHWVDCVQTRQLPVTGLEAAKAVALVIDRVKELL
jgi:predicted dehydrogenase